MTAVESSIIALTSSVPRETVEPGFSGSSAYDAPSEPTHRARIPVQGPRPPRPRREQTHELGARVQVPAKGGGRVRCGAGDALSRASWSFLMMLSSLSESIGMVEFHPTTELGSALFVRGQPRQDSVVVLLGKTPPNT